MFSGVCWRVKKCPPIIVLPGFADKMCIFSGKKIKCGGSFPSAVESNRVYLSDREREICSLNTAENVKGQGLCVPLLRFQLPLVFVIGIPGKPCQFHALNVVQAAVKVFAMLLDDLFCRGCLFYV